MKKIVGSLFLVALSGCVSIDKNSEPKAPPALTQEMPIETVVNAGLEFGDKTLEEAKKIISQKKAWPEVHAMVEKKILSNIEKIDDPALINGVHLLQTNRDNIDPKMVLPFIQADRYLARQLGWQMASRYPSNKMAETLDKALSDAVIAGAEDKMLLPEMAEASQANQLKGNYTLVRRGLMSHGDIAFAKAMAVFEPERSSSDFLNYLGKADLEDLRQLNQKSINVHTAMYALIHLSRHSLPINHPKVETIFLYAVSRNLALAEYAGIVLEKNYPSYNENLAIALSRLPVSVQVAFVEGSNRKQTDPNVGVFLSHLKRVSAHREVVEEIEGVKD